MELIQKTKTASPGSHHAGIEGNLASRYCLRYKCKAGDFEDKLLLRCIPLLLKPLAWWIWFVHPDFFKPDMELILELRYANSFSHVQERVNFYRVAPPGENFAQRWFRVRISKSKLLKIASPLFSATK